MEGLPSDGGKAKVPHFRRGKLRCPLSTYQPKRIASAISFSAGRSNRWVNQGHYHYGRRRCGHCRASAKSQPAPHSVDQSPVDSPTEFPSGAGNVRVDKRDTRAIANEIVRDLLKARVWRLTGNR